MVKSLSKSMAVAADRGKDRAAADKVPTGAPA